MSFPDSRHSGRLASMNYFAYGSNMDVRQMAVRCPDAVVIERACLRGHNFLINTHGVATVIPAEEASVHGILWNISARDEASLDRYEGVATGFYRKSAMPVQTEGGGQADALIYIAEDDQPGQPRIGYMEQVVESAQLHALGDQYLASLGGRFTHSPKGARRKGRYQVK